MKNSELDKVLSNLRQGILPSEDQVGSLCKSARDLIGNEQNVVIVDPPVTVCGDIHGQFPDLLQLFAVAGEIPDVNYLFLGDFVDRGLQSVESILYLLVLKLRYPLRINLIRGNHESRAITQVYGFYDECLRKYGTSNAWKNFTLLFDCLPLAALISDRVFCTHGGLSPSIQTIDQIRELNRFSDVPITGGMSDLLWSDPDYDPGWQPSPRGAGFLFGPDVTSTFISVNGLDFIARAHQLVMEGYKWDFDRTLLTVWSAPNYCYRCANFAAVLELDDHMNKLFIVFDAAQSSRSAPPQSLPMYFL